MRLGRVLALVGATSAALAGCYASTSEREPEADADAVRNAAIDFAEYTAKLGAVNERAILKDHDLELAGRCSAMLEEAQLLQLTDVGQAAEALVNILKESWALYGRDPEFDTFLRKVKKRGAVSFTAEALQQELETVTLLINRIPLAILD